MQASRWPGNVRQLINALEYGVITSRGEEIDVPDLPTSIAADPGGPPPVRRRGEEPDRLARQTVDAADPDVPGDPPSDQGHRDGEERQDDGQAGPELHKPQQGRRVGQAACRVSVH
jgi:DNA-binding NtrC family response regulator